MKEIPTPAGGAPAPAPNPAPAKGRGEPSPFSFADVGEERLGAITILYGEPGTGKTTLAAIRRSTRRSSTASTTS